MKADSVKITDGVYWVGTLDWDVRDFHGYTLDGTTYNAYLVFGENKVALIDNVYPGKSAQFWARIKDAFEKEGREFKIDVMIQNHIELDHSGSLQEVVEKFPDVEIHCSAVAVPGLKNHWPALADVDMNVVGTGDELNIGGRTFAFLNAPMLHWPDSMFTMLMEDGILFSNDAFGQHICSSERYDVDVNEAKLIKVAQKYYANLITLSSPLVVGKLKEVDDLGLLDKIKMIAPSHGQIWTKPETILTKYTEWATGQCKDKITIIYDTMHHSTQKMAHAIAEGVMSAGVQCKLYFLHDDDESDVVCDVLDSKAICLGAPTMMNNPFPNVGKIMYYFNALSFANTTYNRKALVFGSKGWGGGASEKLTNELTSNGFDVVDSYDITYVPTEEVYEKAYELGKKLAEDIKQ